MPSINTMFHAANAYILPGHIFSGPEWLVLGVNNVCNLHCKMCDVGVGNNSTNFAQNLTGTKPLNMPLDLLKKVIDDAAFSFPKAKLGYAFTEPLVYPHLVESLRYANEKQLFTSITTNALTLPQKAIQLSEAGLNEIYISLDGPQDIHNFIRGNNKSFQKAVEGIEVLMQQPKRPSISLFCVVTEWNFEHLKSFLDFFKNYPLKEIGFMHTNYTPDWLAHQHNKKWGDKYPATLSNTDETDNSKIDIQRLWLEIEAIKSEEYPFKVGFMPEIESHERLHQFYHQPEVKFGKRCHDVFKNVMIKSNGDVIPAHGRCYNLTIGNLYQTSLNELWNSKVISTFRKDIMTAGGLLPACSRCCSAMT